MTGGILIAGARGAAILSLAWVTGQAQACACCAERGERFADPVVMTQEHVAQLAARAAEGPAFVFVSACDLDCVEGVTDPQYEYRVEIAVSEAGIDFDLTDMSGAYRGTLGLNWPERYTRIGVDIDPSGAAATVMLYHEMQFLGDAYGTVDFAGIQGASVELTYSGMGNMCFGPETARDWRLSVVDDGVDFRLFGRLSSE